MNAGDLNTGELYTGRLYTGRPAARIAGLTKGFADPRSGVTKPVIDRLDLAVGSRERVGVIGPSGCGKSTLLNIMAGLEAADAGIVEIADPARLAYMFQEPRLLPWRTVRDNLLYVRDDEAAVATVLGEIGLAGEAATHASRLSLGMARRVALARAFISRPALLLMDEPFVSLDAASAIRLRRLLLEMLDRHAAAMLLVTHDLREAIMLCDRLLILGPAPARLLAEIPIGLDTAERLDEDRIEPLRQRIVRDHGLDTASLEVRHD
ncbi:MAG: ATP-binding cassette domain-containing protein [Geminicoccaceae bacterium]